MIELENILKVYDKTAVLDNFSLKIDSGEMIAIVGKSGCGKTSLLNIIGLIDDQFLGTYKYDGIINPKAHSKEGRKILQNNIGFIFQNFGLIDELTVEENFKLIDKYNKGNVTIDDALSTVNLTGFRKKKVFQLSGGEQQRVAIAKHICKGSTVILADEPTGSLDQENKDIVMRILTKLHNEGKTIVIVTHDMEIASKCERIVEME